MAERKKAGIAPTARVEEPLRALTNPDGTMSFKDAAERVLKKARRPLHYKQIVANAIRDRLISLEGKTPEATMLARLGGDISSLKERSRFVKLEPGVYGLASWKIQSVPKAEPTPANKMVTKPAPAREPKPAPASPPAPQKTPERKPAGESLSLEFAFGAEKDLKDVTEALALAGAIYPDFDSQESQLSLICTHFLANHPTDDGNLNPMKRLFRAWEQGYDVQILMIHNGDVEFGADLLKEIRGA
jgi:hypothetical protein